MNRVRRKRGGASPSRWAWLAAVPLCSVIPNAVASDLGPIFSGVWVAATALSLTLITAVTGSQR